MALPTLVELALRSRYCSGGNGRPLAPAGLQALLAMEVARRQGRTPKSRRENSQVDPTHVVREPALGHAENPLELRLLGYDASKATVDKYKVRHQKPPSQTWRTFLDNHVRDIVAVDFFMVPTATFRILFCFIVLRHDRRMVIHFNVTAHPTAEWTAQQIIEAFPFGEVPQFLLRDRDSIYGEFFRQRVKHIGIEEVVTAPRSPWQNPYIERLIGSIRRECLNHVIVLNEAHAQRILTSYFAYYHESRAHLSLEYNAPIPRRVEHPSEGRVIAIPQVGGLHHRYRRAA